MGLFKTMAKGLWHGDVARKPSDDYFFDSVSSGATFHCDRYGQLGHGQALVGRERALRLGQSP